MPATDRLYGNEGAAVVNSTAWALTEWQYEEMAELAEVPAAGDLSTLRVPLRTDWRASVRGVVADTEPYNLPMGAHAGTSVTVGSAVPVLLKLKSSEGTSTPYMTGTGILSRARVSHPATGPTEIECEVIGSDGSALPTVKATPA